MYDASDAVGDGRVDVTVRVVLQQPPHAASRLEGHGALLHGRIEQERDYRIARDVSGDVFFRVVRTHLLLVDVLLEDVAEHIGIDLVVGAVGPLVKVPLVAVEEAEDPLERLVGDADVRVVPLEVVDLEETTVKEGDSPPAAPSRSADAISRRLSQSLMEQSQEEDAVELLEPARLARHFRSRLSRLRKVVDVPVEEPLLLDEVDEHHAVEHERGIPLPVALLRDSVDESLERRQLGPEPLIEPLCDLLDIHRLPDAGCDHRDAQPRLFVEGKGKRLEALEQRFPGLARAERVLTVRGGLAALPFDPLPALLWYGRHPRR